MEQDEYGMQDHKSMCRIYFLSMSLGGFTVRWHESKESRNLGYRRFRAVGILITTIQDGSLSKYFSFTGRTHFGPGSSSESTLEQESDSGIRS